jgi:tripartite-type tricarboxylate transporter receptor subunit TctC
LGQPVIVDNRPGGAGGTVGAKAVANANPDGYTLLFTPAAPLVTAPLIYRNLGYDPFKSFTPVAMVFSTPQMLAVTPTLPVDSMVQLASHAIDNPGKVSFASPGFGTQPHLLGEMFRLATGANIVHVPYKGAQQPVTDLMAGQVQMYFDTVALFLPHLQVGKIKPLAIADDMRSDQLPAVPTTAESGFPALKATFWASIVAPMGTPQTPWISSICRSMKSCVRLSWRQALPSLTPSRKWVLPRSSLNSGGPRQRNGRTS